MRLFIFDEHHLNTQSPEQIHLKTRHEQSDPTQDLQEISSWFITVNIAFVYSIVM